MKRFILAILIFAASSFSVFAQGFYFDIGLGFGKAWTKFDGKDIVGALESDETLYEMAADIGLKAGYGPFGNVPIYVVGELGGVGHRIWDSENYIQFNSYIIGHGIIFYPVQLIQLGSSLGFSFVANQTDIPGVIMYDSEILGVAWNISAAIDLGRGNHGCLIGLKYFIAINTLETSHAEQNTSMIGIFIKYAYRKKVP